ncbi:unnamed protein product [Echinostoma caproni]|uniref:Transposase n=1 Tax=Echinostoma caproni TaxID=27848 RepID=A0A183BCR1_9TREM|nr:unnamed protein product [Echinostoma caproni]
MQRGKQIGLWEEKELDSKAYTKSPHERLLAPGTLLEQSGTQNAIELGDRKIVRRHTDHVRSRPVEGVTVEDSNESWKIRKKRTVTLHKACPVVMSRLRSVSPYVYQNRLTVLFPGNDQSWIAGDVAYLSAA